MNSQQLVKMLFEDAELAKRDPEAFRRKQIERVREVQRIRKELRGGKDGKVSR
jgi:hypothetical protein